MRMMDYSVIYPRGDEDGGHSQAKTVKVKFGWDFTVLAIRVWDGQRGRNVIIKATVLVIGEQEGRLVPRGRLAKLVINRSNEFFTKRYSVGGVLIVCRNVWRRKEAWHHKSKGR